MIVPIGLAVAFVLVVVFAKRGTRNCRWRENRGLDQGPKKYYKCMFCGAEVYAENGKEPRDCHAPDDL